MVDKHDIKSRKDIDELVDAFYAKAVTDEVIGHIFTDVAKINLKTHLPIIGDFWESLVFNNAAYHGRPMSPMKVHLTIDDKHPLKPEHFERWLKLFAETVDETFRGEKATFIKHRSQSIGANMVRKISDRRLHQAMGDGGGKAEV
jgi:hemoglobin